MKIFENPYMTKEILILPRSKKRRIRKKWAKNPFKRKTVPETGYIVAGDGIVICHPVAAQVLRRSLGEYRPYQQPGLNSGALGIFI